MINHFFILLGVVGQTLLVVISFKQLLNPQLSQATRLLHLLRVLGSSGLGSLLLYGWLIMGVALF